MTESDLRAARKAWRERNSDGRNTWEGERSQDPPAFQVTDEALPAEPQRLTNPDATSEDARAERHVHVWSVDNPDA